MHQLPMMTLRRLWPPPVRVVAAISILLALAITLAACGNPWTDSVDSGNDSGGGGNAGGNEGTYQIKSGCADERELYPTSEFTYSNTTTVSIPSVTATTTNVTFTVPYEAVSVGLLASGFTETYKFIDHGVLLAPDNCIRTPVGNAPLAFNQVDLDSPPDGIIEDDPISLINLDAPALFFPNDGIPRTLPSGTYTFPIGGLSYSGTSLQQDTLTPAGYYKVPSSKPSTVSVTLMVAQGVRPGLATVADVMADPEIRGAIDVLRNVYEGRPEIQVTLRVNFATIPNTHVSIGQQGEFEDLLDYHHAGVPVEGIRLYIVGEIAFQGIPAGVVGLSAGIPGPFGRQNTPVSGIVAEYQGDNTGTVLGYTLAHELGHYLGLFHTSQTGPGTRIIGHDPIADTPKCTTSEFQQDGNIDNCPDRSNLMFPIVDENPEPEVTAGQGTVLRLNPAVSYRLGDCKSFEGFVETACASLETELSRDFVFLEDGWIWYGDLDNSRLVRLHLDTGEIGDSIALNGTPGDLEVDRESGMLYATVAAGTSNEVVKVNLATGEVTSIPMSGIPLKLAMGNDGIVFVTVRVTPSAYYHPIAIVDSATTRVLTEVTAQFGELIGYSRKHNTLLTASVGTSGHYRQYTYDAESLTFTLLTSLFNSSNPSSIVISPDGEHAAIADGGGNGAGYTVRDYDTQNVSNTFGEWNTGAYPEGAAFSPDSKYFASTPSGKLKVYRVDNHEQIIDMPLAPVDCSSNYPERRVVKFAPEGNRITVQSQCRPVYYEPATYDLIEWIVFYPQYLDPGNP